VFTEQRKISLNLKLPLVILCLLCCNTLHGQEPWNIAYKQYTQVDGLSSNIANTAVEDQNGIVWIGTQKGLTRFDGNSFKAFNQDNGIELQEVQKLFFDEEVLWCFQEAQGKYLILLFHTLEERLLTFDEYLGQPLPFNESEIQTIQILSGGLIFHLLSNNTEITYSYIPEKGFEKLSFIDGNKQVINITEDGLYWLVNITDKAALTKVNANGTILKEANSNFFRTNIPTKIIEIGEDSYDENNKVFIKFITEEKVGFFSISPAGQLQFEASLPRSAFVPIAGLSFSNLKYYHQKQLILYCQLRDITLYDPHGKVGQKFVLPSKNVFGEYLVSNYFNLYLTQDGIFLASFKDNSKSLKFDAILKKEKVATRGIITSNGQLFINSNQLYVTDINLKNGLEKRFKNNEGFDIIKDRSNNLWIGKANELIYYNTKTKEAKSYPIEGNAWGIYEDDEGQIWFNDNHGITALNPTSGEFTTIEDSGLKKFIYRKTYHIHKKADGLLFLLTDYGIFEFSLQKGVVNRYWSGGEGKYYLPAKDFRHLYFDKGTSDYWIASTEGLIRWQAETGDHEVFKFNNFAANRINALYPDNYDHLWLSTENGIIQFDKTTYKFETYLEKDGITHHEFNRISHFQDTDETIYFGGLEGVTKFHPRDFKNALSGVQNPKITILELNQYLGSTNNIENTTTDFYQEEQIIVKPNDGYFTLKMALTNYDPFSDVQLLYRLSNAENWAVADDNEITIRKLPYGTYTLQIKALGESGQFNKEYLEVPIVIKKPLYLQWWFWLLILLALATAISLFVKWRTNEFKKRNLVLEKEVLRRTAQIENDKKTIEEQANRLLELDKSKSKFFANISHELRTPITLIKGPLRSVLKSKELNKQNYNLLSTAERNTSNLLVLVNEILDLTKLEASKLTLDESHVGFYQFVSKVVANFDSVAAVENIDFSFNYKLDKSLQIRLDEAKFEKILNNLLSNAFKFTPQNGQIHVSVEENNAGIQVAIKDSGRGIAAEDIPNIFNRFYQSKSNTKAEGGLGIGLALSMELVKLMDGKMWVESQAKGSTFFVEIPKNEVVIAAKSQEVFVADKSNITQENNANLPTTTDRKHTILLVEDNADLREYVSFLLAPFYNIVTAKNGKDALGKLSATSCQLILSDVMMPIMDGFEFLDAVKSNAVYRNLPFIMLTARAELKDRLKALRTGVDDYLIKPFDETELLVRIKNLLSNYDNRVNYVADNPPHGESKNDSLSVSERDEKWLQNLEILVLENISNSIFSVDYLVEVLGTNRNTFYGKVKTLTGLSPNKYIQAIRLQKAKELLENSTLSVREITEKVGFKTPDYFTRLFKKEYGKVPSDYLR
jgi:signal transduction histidine kinase/DNA-binding response OmpR family regulator